MVCVVAALRTELLFVRSRPRLAVGTGPGAAARLVAGWGKKSPEAVLVVGFSGATRAELPAGALILASRVQGAGAAVDVPGGLLSAARAVVPWAASGPIQTVDQLAGPGEKARLSLDALAVDMESAHLAGELSRREIPFLVVRSVLDLLWEDVTTGPRARWAARALTCAAGLGRACRRLAPVMAGAR
ncbi:MAG: hypothetical protein ACP5G2_01375 [Candidatus Bipolaricaulaceae bacterium]